MRTATLTLTALGILALTAAAGPQGKQDTAGVVREFQGSTTGGPLLKQVDFAKEYLLLIKWTGSGTDEVSFAVEKGQGGPLVIFRLELGKGKDGLRPFSRLFVLTKDAAWRLEKDTAGRRTMPTIINSAEELKKAFENREQK